VIKNSNQSGFSEEVRQGKRFKFGANWCAFLSSVNEKHITAAENSLRALLGINDFEGLNFLDLGSGSGIVSLAAKRLGAKVHSIDYDPQSVACTKELKKRYYPDDDRWTIAEGSALDEDYLQSLGKFEVVYSWGVLHHTGNLKKALDNALIPVCSNGLLAIAIYNDQGSITNFWKKVKGFYCANQVTRLLVKILFIPWFFGQAVVFGLIKYKNPWKYFNEYKKNRGMSVYYDWIDWLGGYPFEVAKPEEIFRKYQKNGYLLENLITTNKMGCNQYVFRKNF